MVTEDAERSLVERCLAHDPEALRVLERDYVARVDGALAALGLGEADRDEVRQKLWLRLVMGDAPRLASYEGRGTLTRFVRAVAVRLALDEKRSARRTDSDDALLDSPDASALP